MTVRMKRSLCLLFALVPLFCLCSCGNDEKSVKEIISAMSAAEKNAPAGKIYLSYAVPGEAEYISEKLVTALFGDGKVPAALEVVDSFAVRLSSFAANYEYAVFKAKTTDDTAEIAKMLRRRADAVKKYAGIKKDNGNTSSDDPAEIFISGKFVVLLITSDNTSMRTAANSAIRSAGR